MSTETAEQINATLDVDMYEEPESLFISKCINQKLFVKQPYMYVENGLPIFRTGESIEFVNHEFRTRDPRLKAFIRNHRLFGTQITEVTEEDFDGPRVRPARDPNMVRGAATTKPAAVQEEQPPQQAATGEEAQAQGAAVGKSGLDYKALIDAARKEHPGSNVFIPCGYGDCEFVAHGKDEQTARRSLNGHRTVRGHHPDN